MGLEHLLHLIHDFDKDRWQEQNDVAFRALFGSPDGRYPQAAKDAFALRAPKAAPEPFVPFSAYINPQNPSSGAYGGMRSSVWLWEHRAWILTSERLVAPATQGNSRQLLNG